MSTYYPTIFGENLLDVFDDFDRDFFHDFGNLDRMLYGKRGARMMKTDVAETDEGYRVAVELPGFDKQDIHVDLKDGYLTISAEKELDQNSEPENSRMIRRERYAGTMQRSFYVGKQLTEDDIRARYENGVLMLMLPKKEAAALPEKKTILIEG